MSKTPPHIWAHIRLRGSNLFVNQDRRYLFVTPWDLCTNGLYFYTTQQDSKVTFYGAMTTTIQYI
jgi:hypothetical protein